VLPLLAGPGVCRFGGHESSRRVPRTAAPFASQPTHVGRKLTIDRTVRVEPDLVDQLFSSSEKRLARALLLLGHFGQEGRTKLVVPQVSHETLAQMVGTTGARVSTFVNKFKKLGVIESNGGLQVNSSLLKVVIHD